jgi:hypothetical protein
VLHFDVISNVMGVLPQALEILFEVQKKRNNEKIARRNISFPTHKTHFFPLFFSSPWTPLTFKAFNFLISYSF